MSNYKFTKSGLLKTQKFIKECNAKRKEILDAKIDTADETLIPTEDDILCDIDFFIDSDGQYYNNWGVTDNYNSDTPLCLLINKDFIKEITEKQTNTCSNCTQCRYDKDNGMHYCRRSYTDIYEPDDMTACDDFEKKDMED